MTAEGPPPNKPIYVTLAEYRLIVEGFMPNEPLEVKEAGWQAPATLYGRPLVVVDFFAPAASSVATEGGA